MKLKKNVVQIVVYRFFFCNPKIEQESSRTAKVALTVLIHERD